MSDASLLNALLTALTLAFLAWAGVVWRGLAAVSQKLATVEAILRTVESKVEAQSTRTARVENDLMLHKVEQHGNAGSRP